MTLPASVLEAVDAHALEAYPCESCGLVLREPEGPPLYRPCANLAGAEPVVASQGRPRGPVRAYHLDPYEVLRAHREGLEMVAIVHSHPGGEARFSSLDRAVATTMGRDGLPAPTWPGVVHCVVGVRQARVTERRWFSWDAALQGWAEGPGP